MNLGKLFLWGLCALFLSLGAFTLAVFWGLPDVSPLKSRVNSMTISVPDWQGAMHPFQVGPENPYWTPLDSFPDELKWAVIVAEDANFYEHDGVDITALKEALKYDLKHKRMRYGASTITQQLAKNLFLSRDKSVLRKLRELVLATRMERELTMTPMGDSVLVAWAEEDVSTGTWAVAARQVSAGVRYATGIPK